MKKLVMSSMVIVVAVVVFVGTVGSVYALTIDGGRLKSALNEAAKVQVIANTLKRCIPDIKSRSSSGGNVPGLSSQDVKKGDIFGGNSVMVGNTPISGTRVSTGPWLENAIDHKGGDDGKIWCAENHGEIIKLFAQYVLGSSSSYMNGIVCDANGEAGGIFIPYSDDGKTEFGCSSAVRYQKKSGDEITNYIKGLYEAKRHELGNDYWVSWDNLGNYTDQRGRAVGYWLYWNDFDTRCKSNDAETNRKTVSLDYGGETFGLVQDETVRVRANWESASFENIIGNEFTCKSLRDRMDSYASDYAAISLDYLGSQCKSQLSPVIDGKLKDYQNILASGSGSAEDLQKARDYIAKWGNYNSLGNNDFIKQTEKGGYICNEDAGAKVDFAVDQLTPEESIATGENDACYAGSGALGWLICPVVKMLSGIGEHMWNQIETYHLKLPANDLFENGGGVQQAWGTVRDIANVAFVLLFLVVIFSQITGVGIDNYGIKRILPKLIITAILINLSFIICAVAVDLSNIFGMGINSLLTEQADKIAVAQGMSGGVQAASWGMTALLGGGGVALFVVLNPAGALAAAAAIGLAVLGLIITVITSMFFMYITLVVRQAGVILMIVLAPVALACYMLPNTEKLFKKWFDLFKALLIVYPICGALIGAGQLAGAVLASIDSENMKVAAMLVQVVPFFLLPMIIRNSLSLMGNIGNRLAGWGRTLGRRGSNAAQGAIRNNERFKDWQKSQQDRAMENRARRTIRSLSGRTLDRRGQERLAKARAIVLEQERKRKENAINAREDTFNTQMAKQDFEVEEARYDLDKYADANYIAGKREQSRLSRENDRESTVLYADANYVSGKQVQSRLSRENDREGTLLYNTPGLEASKSRQYAANRRGEIRKMYSEQYNNLDKTAKKGQLIVALAGHGVNDAERADAAFNSLVATGDKAEILEAINGADYSTMDANVRERIVALAAASGDPLLKGWAKTGGTMNIDTYISSGRFKNYLDNQAGDNAFNNADKDTLKFLAAHNGAQAMSDTMIKNISVTAANNNQDSANAASALIKSVPGRKAKIGSLVTGDDLTRMSSTIEQAYRINASDARTTTLGSAVADINKSGNEALRSKVNRQVGKDLGVNLTV